VSSTKPSGEINFEQAIQELDEIVSNMENSDLKLDSLVGNYQKGIKLLSICRKKLDDAELKIKEATTDILSDQQNDSRQN
jgi:exodeoxyribonuclease VII small subunit